MGRGAAADDTMNWMEIIATVFGLTCVWLTIRQNMWCWPAGLVQVALYVWVFYQARLYSDMLLHIIYVGLQIYGWHHWLRGGPRANTLPVTQLTMGGILVCLVLAGLGTAGLGSAMHRLTDAALPYWDASIMMLSLVAQFLLARKVLESWLFWITVDVLAIGVYAAKSLYVTTGLYSVFLCMAITGWFAWRQSLRARLVSSAADGDSSSASSCPRIAGTSS